MDKIDFVYAEEKISTPRMKALELEFLEKFNKQTQDTVSSMAYAAMKIASLAEENERLAEVNAELLVALETISAQGILIIYNGSPHWALTTKCKDRADDAIAKAKEQQ